MSPDLDADPEPSAERPAESELTRLGFSPFFEAQRADLGESLEPARVVLTSAAMHRVLTAAGPCLATVSGRLSHEARSRADLPAVGDWVGLLPQGAPGSRAIQHIFARRTCLRRKAAGRTTEVQVLAANVDTVFIVTSMNADFNPRRLERYLEVVIDSGARPVIVLNKADLCPDPVSFLDAAREVAPAAQVAHVSALSGAGLDELRARIQPGETVVLVGSSGVGKSAITNRLLGGDHQREGAVREYDNRGRHTTAHRELFMLPGGGLLIDTPGVRELGLWSTEDASPRGFDDIDALALACRFRDCAHEGEPGCAVNRAVAEGTLAPERLAGFHKLAAERRHLVGQQDVRVKLEEKRRVKQLMRGMRAHPKK